jgi:hypothetical protein
MLFFVWKDIYIEQYNIPHYILMILMCFMAMKFIFDISMVILFIYLVKYFDMQRKQNRIVEKLNDFARQKLKRETIVTTVFVVFYIIRVILMDFGYALLVGMYFVD